jgi:hypothetical protein
MKSNFKILLILTLIFIVTACGTPVKKNPIYGKWKISSGKHNGTAAPSFMMDRIQTFSLDNNFQSLIKTAEGKEFIGNSGQFYLLNDTTMVTYHKDQAGKLDNIANTYNFQVRNDSLHFYGFYLSHTQENPSILAKVFIDEWWVRFEKN